MKIFLTILLAALSGASAAIAQAPKPTTTTTLFERQPEIAFEYTYAHANAPPADCGCFSLNGGSASFAQPLGTGRYAFVFDTTVAHASNIAPGKYDLTLSTFTAGIRYRPMLKGSWRPFGEVLVGAAHASGSLVGGSTPAANDAALVFASNIGGGLDRRLTPHWSLRLVEADYLLTTYTNLVNDHQNNIRISAGVAYHFGKK